MSTRIFKLLLGSGFAIFLSFPALLFLLFSMGIYLLEPGVPARGANCTIASIPFLITVGIVYYFFISNETSYGRAILYTIAAETIGLFAGAMFLVSLIYLKREPRTLLEQRTPFTQALDRGEIPYLPLSSDAVGIELPDGKFYPIMFLRGRLPEHGYKPPLLPVLVNTGPPKLKVYRGTNELAAANHFLGEFQISGYSKTKQALQLMVIFDIETDQRLFLQVRDVDATHNNALKIKRIEATKTK